MFVFFFKLDPVQKADEESLFSILDSNFSDHWPLHSEHLVGFGSDGANVMIGTRNSVVSRLKQTASPCCFSLQLSLSSADCYNTSKVLPDYLVT